MTQKFSIDRNTREGSAFFERLSELPWQSPNEAFPDFQFEALSDTRFRLPKSDPLPLLFRGHGAFDPAITRDGYIHATPFPDNAIWQYSLFNKCGLAGIKVPEWKEKFGFDTTRIPFLSVYEAKPDQSFYSDETLEAKMKGLFDKGVKLSDITVFDSAAHHETPIASGQNPKAMYVVVGVSNFRRDFTQSFGRLRQSSRLACIMRDGTYTEEGIHFMREYQRVAKANLPEARPEVFQAPGLR